MHGVLDSYVLVCTAYVLRKHGARSVPTAYLLRTYCAPTAYGCSGVCTAYILNMFKIWWRMWRTWRMPGVCLAYHGDSTAQVWRTHCVREDPTAYVAYLLRISHFFRTQCLRSSIAGQ